MELKRRLEGSDAARSRAKTEALMEASHKLAQAVYEQAQAEQARPLRVRRRTATATRDDEVVEEADYEVIDEEEAKHS